ncbi:hypothetical protein IQ06DRAFT_302641 [Phaeosphaeriaceae sp. SRC1lsM3a]|nr:hypothetical protein IQ06DRAFT_302641 [Stagonospora sp. SRC1lsM3a]
MMTLADLMAQIERQAQEIKVLQDQQLEQTEPFFYDGIIYEEEELVPCEPSPLTSPSAPDESPAQARKCRVPYRHKCFYKIYGPLEGQRALIWGLLEYPDHVARQHKKNVKGFQSMKKWSDKGMRNGPSSLRWEAEL